MSKYEVTTNGGTYEVETDDTPQNSALGAAGRGALDALPMGDKAVAEGQYIATGSPYSQNLSTLDNLIQTDRNQQPVAHDVGEVAGSVAPFAIPGVGEALGAEGIAGRAGIGAGLGALQAAGNNRNPATLGSDVASGAALGAVANPILGAAGDAVSGALNKAAPALEDFANTKAVQAANLNPKSLGLPEDELHALGQNLRDLDLINGSTTDRFNKAKDLLGQVGQQIGEVGADDLPSYSPDQIKEFTEPLLDSADQSAQVFGSQNNADLNTYRQGIANLQHNGNSFEGLQMLKSAYGEKAFDSAGQIKDPAAAKVYFATRDAMKGLIKSSPEDYQGLMTAYGSLKDITNGLQKQLQGEQASGVNAKGFGLAGKMAGMILGGNPEATAGAAAALAPTHPFIALGVGTSLFTNPQLMSNAAGRAAGALEGASASGIAPMVTNGLLNHPAMKAFVPAFQNAAQGVTDEAERNKAYAVTDYTLSQNNPAYAAAKAKAQSGQ